jgi:hypothetical protein
MLYSQLLCSRTSIAERRAAVKRGFFGALADGPAHSFTHIRPDHHESALAQDRVHTHRDDDHKAVNQLSRLPKNSEGRSTRFDSADNEGSDKSPQDCTGAA